MKAENAQMNVSEVNYSESNRSDNTSSDKGASSGISNAEVRGRFYEKHEYHALSPEQRNTLRLKRGHIGKDERGGGTCGKGGGKRSSAKTIKYRQHTSAALSTTIDQFHLPDDDDD
jgi:hypothetical protein